MRLGKNKVLSDCKLVMLHELLNPTFFPNYPLPTHVNVGKVLLIPIILINIKGRGISFEKKSFAWRETKQRDKAKAW